MKAIIVVWGLVVISAADYLIRPRVTGGRANANTLLILLSFLEGLKAFGAIGIIAGPVVPSLVTALNEHVSSKKVRGSRL